MFDVIEVTRKILVPRFPSAADLPAEDGEPLESNWHRLQINLLVESTHQLLAGRDDYFAGGNMFIYYSTQQLRDRDYRGPDFFVALDVPAGDRAVWVSWEEDGRLPDVIVELLSPSTLEADLTTKKRLYERVFKTPDYFACNPDGEPWLQGWHLNGEYSPLTPDEHGRLWCQALQVWLGPWEGEYQKTQGKWLRFFRPDGALAPTHEEAARAERQRAEAAEAEVARLRAELERRSGKS